MKMPTPFQRLFTDDRPIFFLMAVGAVAMVIWTIPVLAPTLTISVWSIGKFVVLTLVAECLGAMLGFFPGGLFLGVFLRWIEYRNGAPFHEGDEVVILSKRFPGRITRIYQIWPERHEVRVELGAAECRKVTDVFSYTDVYRCRHARVET
jgi:hypothetical protein